MNGVPSTPFTAAEREQLILEHLPQVRFLAAQIHRRIGGQGDIEDLISHGILGLIAGIDAYDSKRGARVCTYVEFRIKGAILDSLRAMDALRRSDRQMAKAIEHTTEALQRELGRRVSHDEVSTAMGMTRQDYDAVLAAFAASEPLSLQYAMSSDDELASQVFWRDANSPSPEETFSHSELSAAINNAVDALDPEDRRLIGLHYRQGITMRVVARMLGIDERQAYDMRLKALRHLRRRLAPLGLMSRATAC